MVTLVWLPMRSAREPICSSARAPASAQTRSPVISGRFGIANTHSFSPAGEKLTPPADVRQSRDAGGRICGGHAADEQRGEADDCMTKAAQVDATNDHSS